MGEKGGKGFSLPKASLKGNDSSGKSKRGRKVQFGYEDSSEAKSNMFSKSGGKVDTPFSKGGKGDNIPFGGKNPVSKEPPPLELKVENELPENAKCLMNFEAAQILEGIQEQMVILSEDPAIKIPVSFDRALQYAKSGSHYTSPTSVRRVLERLKNHGISDGEMCLIANICPESVDEVFALVPSLKGKKSKLTEPLKDALDELANLKHSA